MDVNSFTTPDKAITYSQHLVVWSIKNVSILEQEYSCIKSVEFPLCQANLKWQLKIQMNYKSEFDTISYGLTLKSTDTIKVQFDFGILNDKGEKTNVLFAVHNFEPHNKFCNNEIDWEDKLWPNDTLTIVCNIRLAEEKIETKSQIMEQFGSLLKSDCFTDLTINIDQQQIKAHRSILSVRSEYFNELLTDEINSIKIDNMLEHIFHLILEYIYTGVIHENIIKKNVQQLFNAAHKFRLYELKLICEKELIESMSIESAADILVLAHETSATHLKTVTKHFIASHYRHVELTNGWKIILVDQAKLVNEILLEMVRELINK